MAEDLDKTLAREGTAPHDVLGSEKASPAEPASPLLDDAASEPSPTSTLAMPDASESPARDEMPTLDEDASSGGSDSPSLRMDRRLADFLASHRLAVLLVAVALVSAALGAVLMGIDASRTPSDSLVVSDARARLAAPVHAASAYEVDEPLVLQSVEIVRKHKSSTRRDACVVDVVACFSNDAMETRAEAQLTYARAADRWSCTAATAGNASHRATAGVSHRRTVEQVGTLLEAADTDDATTSLASLYRGAQVEVAREDFDESAQSDTLVLHCKRQGSFVGYECDLTARFRFAQASGAWELVEARASEGAYELGFGPLVGTWRGTFAHQQSTSQKCLAAREAGLTVVVDKATMTQGGDALITGTLSGVAHLHADLDQDASEREGDTTLDHVPFSGHLSSGEVEQDVLGLLSGNNPKRDVAGIVFECVTQDLADGKVTLTLTFGTADAPDAASATLTSTHGYEDTFLLLVPYQRDARFADTFTLEKEE